MVAARAGHIDVVSLLVKHGAKVDAQTRTGPTPKFRTPASNSGSKGAGIVRGGWPERGERDPTPGAKTPLLYATREGHEDIAKLLLDAGAGIEQGRRRRRHAAADGRAERSHRAGADADRARRQRERLRLVRRNPALGRSRPARSRRRRPNARQRRRSRSGLQSRSSCCWRRAPTRTRARRSLPPQRRWITRLGSLSWVDFTGQTPFLRAALAGDVRRCACCSNITADPNINTFNGTTPLMAAAGVNWTVSQTFDEGPAALLEAVKLAQSLGNDVNATNDMGLQAIHGAANRGSDDIIRFLVEKGARLDVADKQGRTLTVWAKGVFLATHPPEAKPRTIALLTQLQGG